MPGHRNSDHFIPLHAEELVELLCGDPALSDGERGAFRDFCRLIAAIHHLEYQQALKKLKAAYAPFDPDADIKSLGRCHDDERQQRLNELFHQFAWLMQRANYRHLSLDEIEPALAGASHWGLPMDVDFGVFERLAMFVRGDAEEKRTRRRAGRLWRLEEAQVPIYQRLVMVLKLRQHERLGKFTDTAPVYLQFFKNIPKLDINMLLPGARVRLSKFDSGKIGIPLVGGLALTIWNIFRELLDDIFKIAFNNPLAWWGLATGTLGYGFRSYFGYQQTRQKYHLSLTRILYFQNLDTNAGVFYRVLDEGEEQDCRETTLAYYFLWRAGEAGCTAAELEAVIESELEKRACLKIEFEIDDALHKLDKLRLLHKDGDRCRAIPIEQALALLDEAWDGQFQYANATSNTGSGHSVIK